MGKKSTLSAAQRAQLVMRLLSKEEPAAQIAQRAKTAAAAQMQSFMRKYRPVSAIDIKGLD